MGREISCVACAGTLWICVAGAAFAAGSGVTIQAGPDGWLAEAQRKEIAPAFSVSRQSEGSKDYMLGISSPDRAEVSGRWVRRFDVPQGNWCRLTARYRAEGVELERRGVLARVIFEDTSAKPIGQPEYPRTDPGGKGDAWRSVVGQYAVPSAARTARVELHLRWSPNAKVYWRDVRLESAEPPGARKVRVAAVKYRPGKRTGGVEENRKLFAGMVQKAAAYKPDVIVLGEGITVVSTGRSYVDVAESVPGPTSRLLGTLAEKHDCYIVAGVYERVDTTVYNTAILLGPDGKLVGTYRKTCLPREEIEGGLTPGEAYPVFETRFGKVGMMICWDIHFPEVARELAINGAEMILVPIWGGNELLVRSRAVENQIHVVTSSYSDNIRTAVWDPRGDALAEAAEFGDIAVADVDLNHRTMWNWLGDFRARIQRERPLRRSELADR